MPSREDLGAQLARITRQLIELEMPLLERRGLTMWEYAALLQVRTAPGGTQQRLAEAIRYDKTRLIALLDGLEGRGLVTRDRSPQDRRARNVRLTDDGRALVDGTQRDIHAMEDDLLGMRDRQALQRLLDAF